MITFLIIFIKIIMLFGVNLFYVVHMVRTILNIPYDQTVIALLTKKKQTPFIPKK